MKLVSDYSKDAIKEFTDKVLANQGEHPKLFPAKVKREHLVPGLMLYRFIHD
jgi:hypothetical protein